MVFLVAETSTSWTSPPISSTITSCCSSSSRTFCGLASGLSILLIATIIGTPAALVWLIASIVCGRRPSSAATTRMTISVTLAPRARISVKASWPGVSRKVTFDLSGRADLIGADMLGDAAGLAGDDVGAADRVEQRGLAVVDMAHDRDHRRTRLERLVGIDVGRRVDVDVGFADPLDVVAELGDQQLGRVLVDRLVDRDRHAHLEQRLDQVGGALGHAVGELPDGDRLGHDDVADLLVRRAGLHDGARFSFSRARRSAASERARLSSSPDSARVTVSLPRWRRSSRPRLGRAGSGRLGAGAWPRRPADGRAPPSLGARRGGFGCDAAARRRRASSSRAAGGLLGGSSSALRFSSARRSRPRSPRPWRGPRGGGLPRARSCALPRPRAAVSPAAPCARRCRRRPTGWRGCGAAGRARLRRRRWRLGDRLGRTAGGGASPGWPRMRRFLTSTTTVFERPWLKLCFTLPASTVRLSPSGGRVPSFGFSVWSVILILRQILQPSRAPRRVRRLLDPDRGH